MVAKSWTEKKRRRQFEPIKVGVKMKIRIKKQRPMALCLLLAVAFVVSGFFSNS